jgi:hypothetical protein
VVDEALVPVLAAEIGVAVGAAHLEHAVGDLEDRDVERPAAEVEHGDPPGSALVETDGERGGGRLVQDPQHLEAGDPSRVLGGLALRVVEVGGNRDHGLLDRSAEEVRCRLAHLREHHRRDLLRRIGTSADRHAHVAVQGRRDRERRDLGEALHFLAVALAADHALDRVQRIRGVGHRLPLRDLADQLLAGARERHHRGRRSRALGIGDHLGLAVLEQRNAGVRGSEVDADDFSHAPRPPTEPWAGVSRRFLPRFAPIRPPPWPR